MQMEISEANSNEIKIIKVIITLEKYNANLKVKYSVRKSKLRFDRFGLHGSSEVMAKRLVTIYKLWREQKITQINTIALFKC